MLERDRPEYRSFGFELDVFFSFNSSLQSIGPVPFIYDSSCEFIDDLDLSISEYVILVSFEENFSMQRTVDCSQELDILSRVQVAVSQSLFNILQAGVC